VVQVMRQGGAVFIERKTEVKPDQTPPVISEVKVEEIGSDFAVISWKTNEKAGGLVKYGTTLDYEKGYFGDPLNFVTSHSVTLKELIPGTRYHFKIVSQDRYGNFAISSDQTFTTLEITPEAEKEALENLPEEEKQALETVKKGSQTFVRELLKVLPSNPHLHAIPEKAFISTIIEITPKIVSPPLIATEVPEVKPGPTWAEISWITDKKSNSLVAYAEEENYHPEKEEPYEIIVGNPDEMVTEHFVKLVGLKPNTLYHFQVRSKGKLGGWAKSKDFTFKTLSLLPEISDVKFLSIKETEITLSWLTSVPTKSIIEITNLRTGEKIIQEDPNFLKAHQIRVQNLEIGTNYHLQIKAIDEKGNEALSSVFPFSTSISKNPPIISNIRVVSSLIPGRIERVQTIITWKTDKPATSRVFWQEGISKRKELPFKTPLDKKLTLDHIVITTAFRPGKVYQFKVESIDSFGNRSLSKPFTILTPQPRQSVVELILKHFEETFGFLKRLRL